MYFLYNLMLSLMEYNHQIVHQYKKDDVIKDIPQDIDKNPDK